MNTSKDYFGIHRIISLILVIIPVTCWALGLATRLAEKKYIAAIVRLLLGWNILWICDIINTIINGCRVKICRCLNI